MSHGEFGGERTPVGSRWKSARGLAHSKTLARMSPIFAGAKRLGVRRPSAASARRRGPFATKVRPDNAKLRVANYSLGTLLVESGSISKVTGNSVSAFEIGG
jgi:hypothetical protein